MIMKQLLSLIVLSIYLLGSVLFDVTDSQACTNCIPDGLITGFSAQCSSSAPFATSLEYCASTCPTCQNNCSLALSTCLSLYQGFSTQNDSLIECVIDTSQSYSLGCNVSGCNYELAFDSCCSGIPLVNCSSSNTVDWTGNIPFSVCNWTTDRFEPELFINVFDSCSSNVIILIRVVSEDFQPTSFFNYQGRFYAIDPSILTSLLSQNKVQNKKKQELLLTHQEGLEEEFEIIPNGDCSLSCSDGYLYLRSEWNSPPLIPGQYVSSQIWTNYYLPNSTTCIQASCSFAIIGFTNELGSGAVKIWNDNTNSFVYVPGTNLVYNAWNKFGFCHYASGNTSRSSIIYYVNDAPVISFSDWIYAPAIDRIFLQAENRNISLIDYYWTNLNFNLSLVENCTVTPVGPIPVDCTNNDLVVEELISCQQDCPSCTVCGQVFAYCSDQNRISANFTLDYCNVVVLNGIPTSSGVCPFNATLSTCCQSITPPVTVPVSPPVVAPVPIGALRPVLDCFINDGFTCTAFFGYSNGHNITLNVTVGSGNRFFPLPQDRGQSTLFFGNTRSFRTFNVTRPCSSGNLVWILRDPITGQTRTSTAGNMTDNTCFSVPISPPVTPPPVTPNNTAVCSLALYQSAFNCITNTSLGLDCATRSASCQLFLNSLGNDTQTDQCILFGIAGSNNSLGDCGFISTVNSCCGTLPAGNISCTTQSDCPINYVCTANPGTCSGIQNATCGLNQSCSNQYTCSNSVCINSAFNRFQSAIVNQCSLAPTLGCNTTASIALQESNTLPTSLTCSNPPTTFNSGSVVAYFYVPSTNATFDTLNTTFTVFAPTPTTLVIRVLLPCGSGFCDRPLTPTQLAPGLFSYNHFFDYNAVGIRRGYALIVPRTSGTVQLPPLNGLIVSVTTRCIRDQPIIPIAPPVTPIAPPPRPPSSSQCEDDADCQCGFCCQKGQTNQCLICPQTCQRQNDCSPFIPRVYCTSIGRCTSNRLCEVIPPAAPPRRQDGVKTYPNKN